MSNAPSVFLCSCDNSQKINAKSIAKILGLKETPEVYEQLCRAQINRLSTDTQTGDQAIICCTQEAPVLLEAWAETHGDDTVPSFVNIRENAGWSDDGDDTAPKMAALIAERQCEIDGTTLLSIHSDGRTLILADSDVGLDAAQRLSDHLDVQVLLTKTEGLTAPKVGDVLLRSGSIKQASGALGRFALTVEDLKTSVPSARSAMQFIPIKQPQPQLEADIVLDLRKAPSLFPSPQKRDGYLRADPANPALVEKAIFDALNLVGEFEKPRYVLHNESICAHSRNSITACTKCIDVCPTAAIQPDGDHVIIDPYICAGCGECSTVCPTGANRYQYPAVQGVMERASVLLSTYIKATDHAPVLLLSAAPYGTEVIAAIARHGRGLPAHVIPFTLNTLTSVGIDTLLSLFAHGAGHIQFLSDPSQADDLTAVLDEISYANVILENLGYGANRITVNQEQDPDAISETLWAIPKEASKIVAPFKAVGDKREVMGMALDALHAHAPSPKDHIELPLGAPFGQVIVDEAACTLCLACTSACPASALKDNTERPELRFRESACVQCGLCKKTCPEKAITLLPRIDFTQDRHNFKVLKSEEPFDCIRCGTPFGTKSSIMVMEDKLKDHPMFQGKHGLDKIKMCEKCRVEAMTEEQADPYTSASRPPTKTTEDYIREREEQRARNEADKLN